jgi:hypothetical protein
MLICSYLERRARQVGASRARILLLGSFDPLAHNRHDAIIKDPYFENDYRLFVTAFDQCTRSCAAFIDSVYN